MSGTMSSITRSFGMSDEAWRRHAHPWSVYTRFATIPPLILSFWSRTWIGWWCLVPVAAVVIWLWLNPHVFPVVDRPVRWASRGIFGERIWAERPDLVPPAHRTAFRLIAVPAAAGSALLVWGVIALDVWPTASGAGLVVLAQLWRIDRLVWMYDELVRNGRAG